MIKQRQEGRINTIISDAGRVGETHLEVYSAAKAGASGFMRPMAKSLGKYNFTAYNVAITRMKTQRTETRFADVGKARKY